MPPTTRRRVGPRAAALGLAILTVALVNAPAPRAAASCFCMIPTTEESSLADDLKNPATAVFLLRDGSRTVLTVEPAYEGPQTRLSMIVPLPSAIERSDVRTISGHHFRRLDRRTAPRLTHAWEACGAPGLRPTSRARGRGAGMLAGALGAGEDLGVEVEETWDVDEYDVALLSAEESSGLLTFLRRRGLTLPDRAGPLLRSYIETGHRFALIEADPGRAEVVAGRMMLSPLQLAYDSEELRVPVRLGTLNSPGEQELLLYVLSREGRYEVANRESLVMGSGAELDASYEGGFAPLYRGLVDELFRQHPGAAVTEYAATLANPWSGEAGFRDVYWLGLDHHIERTDAGTPRWRDLRRWTLTRIRHRYGTELDDDLVLRPAAEPLSNREPWPRGQSRYVVEMTVRHPGERCPSWAQRRAEARDWATSRELWEGSDTVWPGAALAATFMGIEPGSSPPAPAPPPGPPEETARVVEAPAPVGSPPPPVEATPRQQVASSCGIRPASQGRGPAWIAGLLAAGLAFLGRRRASG